MNRVSQQPLDSIEMKMYHNASARVPTATAIKKEKKLELFCCQNTFNRCANRWLLVQIPSNSQIWREMSNNCFLFVRALTRFPCRENVVPEMIKHYRYAMSCVVNNSNTYDSAGKKWENWQSWEDGNAVGHTQGSEELRNISKLYCQNTANDSNL